MLFLTLMCISTAQGEAFVRRRAERIYDWGYRYFKLDGHDPPISLLATKEALLQSRVEWPSFLSYQIQRIEEPHFHSSRFLEFPFHTQFAVCYVSLTHGIIH